MKPLSSPPLILASTSPRRLQLLEQVQLSFKVQAPQVEEVMKDGEDPRTLVIRLACEKAESVTVPSLEQQSGCIVLAADTIVVSPSGNQVLGKPKDQEEAKRTLRTLSGQVHTVLTGYCILQRGKTRIEKQISKVVESQVKMRSLTDEIIQRYVDSGEPMDKAGAYGAQGLGMALIERIEGSYTNVVGLPMTQILMDLETEFHFSLFSWLK